MCYCAQEVQWNWRWVCYVNGCNLLSLSQIQFLKDFEHVRSAQEDVNSTSKSSWSLNWDSSFWAMFWSESHQRVVEFHACFSLEALLFQFKESNIVLCWYQFAYQKVWNFSCQLWRREFWSVFCIKHSFKHESKGYFRFRWPESMYHHCEEFVILPIVQQTDLWCRNIYKTASWHK